MKLQPNALRFHNYWQGEVTRSLLCVVGCFVSIYSSYENWVLWLDSSILFHMTHQKQKPTSFSLLLGGHGFCFSFGKNITFPFPFCWVVMAFVFPLAKTSHFLFPFCWVVMAFVFPLAKHHIFYLFAMLGTENWTEAFCFQIEEVFDQVSIFLPPSLPPSPKEHENQECF